MANGHPVWRALRGAVEMRRGQRGPLRPSWELDFETWTRFLHHYSKRSIWLPLSWQRKALDIAPGARAARGPLETASADGVPAAWFRGEGDGAKPVVLYLHGGGYSVGSIASHRDLIVRLSRAGACDVLAIEYRLAPEHRFPAGLDDSKRAYRWLLAQGIAPSRIVIAGDSAGGGMTMATLLSLRDDGERLPAGGLLFSPWVDLRMRGATLETNHRFDYVSRAALEAYARRYVDDHERGLPLVSPIDADLAGLPPLCIQAGEAETLLDDARGLAERARAAGVEAELRVFADMIHVFQIFAPLPAARQAVAEAGAFVRRVTRV